METKEIVMWVAIGLLTLSNISLHMDTKQDDAGAKRVGSAMRAGVEARSARGHNWSQARGEWLRRQRTRPEGKKEKPRVK